MPDLYQDEQFRLLFPVAIKIEIGAYSAVVIVRWHMDRGTGTMESSVRQVKAE